jgi:hypothetical protein
VELTADQAEATARDVHESTAVEGLARLGLLARGIVWFVVGLLVVSGLVGGTQETDANGALRAIAARPLGDVLLVALALGFLGYGGWNLLTASVGHRDRDGHRRTAERVVSAVRGLVYTGLAVLTARFVLPGGGEGDQTSSVTADVMTYPGGRFVVGLVGVAVVAVGVEKAVSGVRRKHSECLEHYRIPRACRRPAVVLGAVGLVGRGLVLLLLGAFLVLAAVRFDPGGAKGLDAVLQSVAAQPFGAVMLGVAAVGLLAYGLWSFVEAAYRDL